MQYIMDIGLNMINAEKYIKLFLKKKLKSYNLNATEGLILLLFLKQENNLGINVEMTQETIMQNLQYDKGVITRSMQSIERKGFVVRKSNPIDGRSFIFLLSDKANEVKHEFYTIVEELDREIFKDFEFGSVENLSNMIQSISDNAWNYYKTIK